MLSLENLLFLKLFIRYKKIFKKSNFQKNCLSEKKNILLGECFFSSKFNRKFRGDFIFEISCIYVIKINLHLQASNMFRKLL